MLVEHRSRLWFTPRRIRELRELLGLTQEEAGQRVGVGARAWGMWECGASIPNKSACIVMSGKFAEQLARIA